MCVCINSYTCMTCRYIDLVKYKSYIRFWTTKLRKNVDKLLSKDFEIFSFFR